MFALSRTLGLSILALFTATGVALSAETMMGARQTMHALTGHWTCITHDNHHKTSREVDTYSTYGTWLRVDATYPAQNGQPAATGINFFGYDAKHHRWIVGGFDTAGGYYISYSTSPSFNGSHWSGGYPMEGGSATVMMPNNNRYTIDSSGGGAMGVSHTVCTRS